jgi:hypothetical protein
LASDDLILKAVTNGSWQPWNHATHPAQYMKNMGMDVSHGLMSAMRGNIHLIIIIGKIGAKEEHRTSASDKFAFHLNLNLELKDRKQQQRGSHGRHGTMGHVDPSHDRLPGNRRVPRFDDRHE